MIKPERCPFLFKPIDGKWYCKITEFPSQEMIHCDSKDFPVCFEYARQYLKLTIGLPLQCPLQDDCSEIEPKGKCEHLELELDGKDGYLVCPIYLKWQVKGMNEEVKQFMLQYIHPKKESEVE